MPHSDGVAHDKPHPHRWTETTGRVGGTGPNVGLPTFNLGLAGKKGQQAADKAFADPCRPSPLAHRTETTSQRLTPSKAMNLIRTDEQQRLDRLQQQAWLVAVNLSIQMSREGNSRGRLQRLLALAERATARAERRYQATLKA